MKIALLTTDSREHFGEYERSAPYFGTAPEALLQGFAMLPEVEVHVVSCLQKPVQSPEKIAPNIWFHGLHVPKSGWLRTGYQGCIRAIRNTLKQIQPDIVHGQGTERDCAISAVLSGYPNVLTIHGNMQVIAGMQNARPLSFYWLAAKLERFSLQRTDGVVCITDYTRKNVTSLARRTWLVPNAVDASFFDIRPQEQPSPTMLYVGNISPRKNQNAFIEAMDGVSEMRKQRLVFLGSKDSNDPYAKRFDHLLAERPWCTYGGFADRERLKLYLSQAQLLVLASLEDNCPMVVLEAMASGLPVIASEVGGIPELITDRQTGFLCDPTNLDSMRTIVNQFLDDRALGQEIGVTARKKALTSFHPKIIASHHLEIYRDVLARR
ncbi:MAG: glycosyltransferase family 4 protein [Chthoniobacterales bacterium]